jgi:hypothetical protein
MFDSDIFTFHAKDLTDFENGLPKLKALCEQQSVRLFALTDKRTVFISKVTIEIGECLDKHGFDLIGPR